MDRSENGCTKKECSHPDRAEQPTVQFQPVQSALSSAGPTSSSVQKSKRTRSASSRPATVPQGKRVRVTGSDPEEKDDEGDDEGDDESDPMVAVLR